MREKIGYVIAAFVLVLFAAPAPARAQSAIAGLVKDATGGVLPGVVVEASSPALIERTRTAITDGSGQYKIVDLRPGVYSVTFTLSGFTTLKRDGLELPSSFTATVNAEMKVGGLEQVVIVTADPPIVDVQNSVAQSVMTRQLLDAIPSGRDPFAVGQLIPGITTAKADVAGSEGMQQPVLQVHGSDTRDMLYQQDGMIINNNFGNGNQTGFYYNDLANEEISYQTSALPAEVGVGGVRINMITKQGGNDFHGALFTSGANHSMQANNQSAALMARGLKVPNSLSSVYDINVALGGPIKRDALWFFASYRRWSANRFVANTFNRDGSQALDDGHQTNGTFRFTYAPNAKNKVFFSEGIGRPTRGHRRDNQPATFVQPEAALLQTTPSNYLIQAKWTATLSNRLLLEAGGTQLKAHFFTGYRPETGTNVTKYDFGTSVLYNAPIYNSSSNPDARSIVLALTYTTGQHNIRTGVQIRWGPYYQTYEKNDDMMLEFNNGVANAVLLYNTPIRPLEYINADDAFYVQDSWTRKRLTVNAGVRYDYFKQTNPAQSAPAGTWVPARSYPEIAVVKWNTVVPRLGVVYDLSGNGKTAIKASASKYVESEGAELGQLVNPLFLTSNLCAWADSNHNGLADPNEISACQGFAGSVSTRIDPNLKRPHQWEYVAMLQHELSARLSVSLAYYHRRISDMFGVRNLLVPPDAYSPVTITNPLTGEPLTIYNQAASRRGLQDSFLTNQDVLWRTYNGFEMKFEKRFANGGAIVGGFTAGKTWGSVLSSSTDLNNPNNLINAMGYPGYDSTYQANIAGSWMLPFGIQWSGAFRTATGLPLARSYPVTRSIVPGLTQVTQNVLVVPTGTVRLQNNNLLDMRLGKIVRVKGLRLEPIVEIFNILNSNATTGEVTTVGPALGTPSSILDGRLVRVGIQMKF